MTTVVPPNPLAGPKSPNSPGSWAQPSVAGTRRSASDLSETAFVEHSWAGPALFACLVLLGGIAGGVLMGSLGAGMAFAAMIGGLAAILIACL